MKMYAQSFLWQNILSQLTTDIFKNKHITAFSNNAYWYMYKILEMKYM